MANEYDSWYSDAYSGEFIPGATPAEWDAYGPGFVYYSAPTAGSGYTYDSMGNVVPVGDPSAATADTSGLAELQNKINEAVKAGSQTDFFKLAKDFLSSPAGAAAGLAGLGSLFGLNDPKVGGFKGDIPALTAIRKQLDQPEYKPYSGEAVMGRRFFSPVAYAGVEPAPAPAPAPAQPEVVAAGGGLMAAKGRYLRGSTDGMADELNTTIEDKQPARLSHGEFVVPADVVSHLGNGNSDAGAQVLYKMMDRVRKARTGTKKQGKRINPEKFTPGGIASYASGGTVNFQTGGSTSNTGVTAFNPYGTTTQTTLSEWAGPYVTGMLGQARALSQLPYQAYEGPLSAGYSPLQQKYFSGIGALGFPSNLGQSFTGTVPFAPGALNVGTGLGGIQKPSGPMMTPEQVANKPGEYALQSGGAGGTTQPMATTGEYTGPFYASGKPVSLPMPPEITSQYGAAGEAYGIGNVMGPLMDGALPQPLKVQTIADQYMNPYMQQVLQPQLQAMQRQADIQRNVLGAQAAKAGAFGGARSNLMGSQLNAELMRQQQQATGQAYGNAYQQAMQQFNIEQQQAQQLANMLGGAGALQRGIEQEGISALRGQFEEERKFPYAQLQFMQSMLQGLPIGTTSIIPNTSTMGQIGQAGTDMMKLYDLLKNAKV